jgi:hypothetical protein
MFGAIPLLVVPILLKQQTAFALEASGVPMSGSAFGRDGVGQLGAAGDGSVVPSPGGAGAADGSVLPPPESAGPGGRAAARVLVMVAAAFVLVVVFSAAVTSHLRDPAVNEVVAFSSGGPATSTRPSGSSPSEPGTDPGTSVVGADEGSAPPVDPDASSTTTSPDSGPSTPSGPTSTAAGTRSSVVATPGPTAGGGGGGIASAPVGVAPTSTQPPGPSASISLSPTTMQGQRWLLPNGPVLAWSVSGAGYTQTVTGPNLSTQTAPSGSMTVCPGVVSPATLGPAACSTTAGSYNYELKVFDLNHTVVFDRTIMLVVQG